MSRYFEKITEDELGAKIVKACQAHEDFDITDFAESAFVDFNIDKNNNLLDPPKKILHEGAGWLPLKWLNPKLHKDLTKVDFDDENQEADFKEVTELRYVLGLCTLENGLTYFGVMAGGDWEQPLFYIIYWDGKQLRGYIPKKGNVWNHTTKKALGNAEFDEETEIEAYDDFKDLKKRGFDVDPEEFDPNYYWDDIIDQEEMQKEMMKRILPKS